MPIDATWEPRDVTFFTATTDRQVVYCRAKTFDRIDGRLWHVSAGESVDAAADEDLSELTADAQAGDGEGLREVVATITLQDIRRGELVAPQDPEVVDIDTTMETLGTKGGPFQVLRPRQALEPGAVYEVLAYEPDLDPASEEGLTAATLRRAARGGSPPDWIDAYLRRPEGGVGAETRRIADVIRRGLPAPARDDRYQLALAVQEYLTSPRFRYDVSPERCPRDSTISDCLLESREGFCQQYATTMVMLLRQLEVPARYVVGFLPGVEEGEQFVVGGGAAHAWVEVWFDGFGWLRFDPTPGAGSDGSTLSANGQTQTELLAGNETPAPDEFPDETFDPNETFGPAESFDPDATEEPSPEPSIAPGAVAPGDPGSAGTTLTLAVVAGLALIAALGLIAFLWFRRLPGGGPDHAWRGITSFAARFGRGPTATQTPYEYSMTLERVVPRVAQDLRAVADAKVAATYGRDHAPSGSTAALRAAYARARTGLLALLFRRR
jgi:transglutaminase-like putative cysteine protease